MCRLLGVSVSGYYAWRKRPPSQRHQANAALLVAITRVYQESDGAYGSPRIQQALQQQGCACSRNRVARVMRTAGIQGKHKRKRRVRTTDSDHALPVAPNHLAQEFAATAPNQKWVTDITYIPTAEGWLYLAAVLDLFSRRIVGWAMADTLQTTLVLAALQMALTQRRPAAGLLHHSDRGSQYASADYQSQLTAAGIMVSMSWTGNCLDNAAMESFWAILKRERTDDRTYATRSEAKTDIFRYIEGFYNRRRLHSTLGYLSPQAFEQGYWLPQSAGSVGG